LDASSRWLEVVKDAQYQQTVRPRETSTDKQSPVSPARQRWRRVTDIARRAAEDDIPDSASGSSNGDAADQSLTPEERDARHQRRLDAREKRRGAAKQMELQYWLEMVDHKHRHGSNLRKYHAHWQKQDTEQSFFFWLDHGDGKDLDLEECSRERLDRMQVRYLSRAERYNYLVKIQKDTGLLVWAKNGERVWTKDELYKDSLEGIVPASDPTPEYKYNVRPEGASSDDSSSSESDGYEEPTKPDEGEQYINEDFHRARGPAKFKHVSAAVVFNHMIRTSLKKGHKWIFVADTSFRLYIGYKQAGAFQHSSFLHGSRILAAGQIKVKDGQLRRLSPLSGHYRPATSNFRAFVQGLKDQGTDMSHVSISQSYAVLVGLEGYVKTRRKIKKTETDMAHQKDRLMHPEKAKQEEAAQQDKSQSALKERQHLEKQRLEEERAAREAKAARSPKSRVARWLKNLRVKDEERQPGKINDGRRIPGSGPEDGVPQPDGRP
jgi:hypothetical protein